ncbi:MAG: hypothetical protein NPIRA02_42610 [Nitrospirales bacterium]|nr:MAG: hypothetical protein NPIRA02_42610 [Nitrospirales bacterium]
MGDLVHINSNNPLVGEWVSSDGFSDVIVTISISGNKFSINVVDASDDEVAEVFEVTYVNKQLKFNVHWPSSGRFIKYAFLLTDNDTVSVSYIYSGQETWKRR